MKYNALYLVLVVCLGLSGTTASTTEMLVEICDNAIDDDGDGLIDLNDTDCACEEYEPQSLIPNPSFEDRECCPNGISQMFCSNTWIQASEPTTDYLHTCGWMGWQGLPPPLPFPDGEGVLGFRDGRYNEPTDNQSQDESNPNWKEYAGACLIRPLRAGTEYRFEFYIGFTRQPHSPRIDVTFFGTTNCENLPFGTGNVRFGCPTNGPNWLWLDDVSAFGTDTWIKKEIKVTPSVDIHAIAIGPPCEQRNLDYNPYYFFDNLILAEESAFEFDIRPSDQPCAPDLSLSLPYYDTLNYQWYKDGIALVGETDAVLENMAGNGEYRVLLTSPFSCVVTKPYSYMKPVLRTSTEERICRGETFRFNDQQLDQAGIYFDTLKSIDFCDSIVLLDLKVEENVASTIEAKIFPDETYLIGSKRFKQIGQYVETIPSYIGCDSTVYLTLEHYQVFVPNIFSPNTDGQNDFFSINGGDDLVEVVELLIFDRWGNLVFEGQPSGGEASNSVWDGNIRGEQAPTGTYLYKAQILMDDGKERGISGTVILLR